LVVLGFHINDVQQLHDVLAPRKLFEAEDFSTLKSAFFLRLFYRHAFAGRDVDGLVNHAEAASAEDALCLKPHV